MTTRPVTSITDEQLAEIERFLGFGGSMLKTKREAWEGVITRLRAAEQQSAPQGKFRIGDHVRKTSGSEWVGKVVGWYSTELTPEGYAVESDAHAGSVQIYPAKALEAVE